jgi:NAD(P)-dependent dehydrogenase (short-subunit alcohol dehydrogenase family)
MVKRVDADLSGRVCLVTGASSGIGRQTAGELARMGARVVLACRDQGRGEAALAEIAARTGSSELELALVDVSSQASIRTLAREVLQELPALHVLVNNAGTWSSRRRSSPDGIELTWATNVLGSHLLTELALPLLKSSAPARVINVASRLARDLDLDDVEFRRRPYDGVTAYAQSKQANRMLTWILSRSLEGSGVTANAMHPGGVNTGIFAKGGGWAGLLGSLYGRLFGRSVEDGADTVVWLAASPDLEAVSGRFWVDRTERRCRFRDPGAERALLELCSAMTRGGAETPA